MPSSASNSAHLTESVPFAGGMLAAMRVEGRAWLLLRPACVQLGLDEEAQRKRLKKQSWATTSVMEAVGSDGKLRQMFCLRSDRVAMWLATLSATRISDPAIRKRVELWQCNAADALDAWARGEQVGTESAQTAEHVSLGSELRDILALLKRSNENLARTNDVLAGELIEQRRARRRLERQIAAAERPASAVRPPPRGVVEQLQQDLVKRGQSSGSRQTPGIVRDMGYCSTEEMADALGITPKAFRRRYQRAPELRAMALKLDVIRGLWWLKKDVCAFMIGEQRPVGHA